MPLPRRSVLLAFSTAMAQSAKPVCILAGFTVGGGSDAIARLLADKRKEPLGVPVVVDNRPGAGGQIAAQALKAAPADGPTLFLSHDHTISILPLVVKNPGYHPADDFVPVACIAIFVNAFAASGGTPAKGFGEYVDWIKAQGGSKGAVGIPVPASTPEFLVKLLGEKYKLASSPRPTGAAPLCWVTRSRPAWPRCRTSSRTTRPARCAWWPCSAAALPEVPTFSELCLKGFEDLPCYGLYAPRGMLQRDISHLTAALAKVLASPEVRKQLTELGLTVGCMTPGPPSV